MKHKDKLLQVAFQHTKVLHAMLQNNMIVEGQAAIAERVIAIACARNA